MDWKECLNNKTAKEINIDAGLISSLIKTSNNKLQSQKKLYMDEVTANSKISLAYDSLRELLEALAIKNGYKIYNHECYTSFLKEVIKNSNLGDEFDVIRKIRNDINYYGKEINIEEANYMLLKIINLRKIILKFL